MAQRLFYVLVFALTLLAATSVYRANHAGITERISILPETTIAGDRHVTTETLAPMRISPLAAGPAARQLAGRLIVMKVLLPARLFDGLLTEADAGRRKFNRVVRADDVNAWTIGRAFDTSSLIRPIGEFRALALKLASDAAVARPVDDVTNVAAGFTGAQKDAFLSDLCRVTAPRGNARSDVARACDRSPFAYMTPPPSSRATARRSRSCRRDWKRGCLRVPTRTCRRPA